MEIVLPKTLKQFAHDDIVRILKRLNSRFRQPHRASWPQGVPDLEEPVTREVVEVAVARDLRIAWGQCLYYYRMGASQIHLVLSPRLHISYKKDECSFVRENPIPKVIVYELPDIRFHVSNESKTRTVTKQPNAKSIRTPMLQYVTSDKEIDDITKLQDAKRQKEKEIPSKINSECIIDEEQEKLKKSVIEDLNFGLVPVLTPLGHVSYISKGSYEREKEKDGSGLNFWRPLRRKNS